jgi:hypothetical protein
MFTADQEHRERHHQRQERGIAERLGDRGAERQVRRIAGRVGALAHERDRQVEEAADQRGDRQRLRLEAVREVHAEHLAAAVEARDHATEHQVADDRRRDREARHPGGDARAIGARGRDLGEQREVRRDDCRERAPEDRVGRREPDAGRGAALGAERREEEREEGEHEHGRSEQHEGEAPADARACAVGRPADDRLREAVHEAADEEQRADARRRQQHDGAGQVGGRRIQVRDPAEDRLERVGRDAARRIRELARTPDRMRRVRFAHSARNARTDARNASSWSWCTQWPAFGIVTRRACRNGSMRPSFSGSLAHESAPRTNSVGHVTRLQSARMSSTSKRYGAKLRT